jgi:RimJ/RimL family protein N-acetyltransferase
MIISRYGVRLISISQEHLELIRYWRNSDKIRNVMEYREFITQKMQLKWFSSLDFLSDFYFVIEYHENLTGLIHVAKVDWKNKSAQSGLFVWEGMYQGSPVPVIASVNLLDTFFGFFNLEKIEAKVKHDNFVAISYNKFLGFEEIEPLEKKEFLNICLTKKNYGKVADNIKQHLEDTADNVLNISLSKEQFQKFHKAGIQLPKNITEGNVIVE